MNIGNITSNNSNLDYNGKVMQIEVYEQLIEQLQQENQLLKKENKILRENSENNDKVVDKVNWENMLLKKENKQLKDNWNKLKEYIKETKLEEFEKSYGKRFGKTFTQAEIVVCNMILDKMKELQGSDSNE